MRRKVARDANHQAIADALRKRGVDVIDLAAVGDVPDILCCYRGFIAFIEIKIPGSKSRYQMRQLRFIGKTKVPVAIVTDEESAFRVMSEKEGLLTAAQKQRLLAFATTYALTQAHPAAIERVLKEALDA